MKKLFYTILVCVAATPSFAQLKVGGSPALNAGAMLQVDASGTKGAFQLPRVALTSTSDMSTVASPQVGFTLYNTATAGTAPSNVTPGYYYFDGTQWVKIVSTSSGNDKNIYDGNGFLISNRTVNQSGRSLSFLNTIVNGFSVGSAFSVDGLNQRVGIGTIAPSQALDVNGNFRFSGSLMPNGLSGSNGQILISTGANLAPIWANTDSLIANQIANGSSKDSIISVVSNNIFTNGRIDTVLSKVITTTEPLRDSILSLITTNIKTGNINGNNLSNENGIIVNGGIGTTLKNTSLRLDSSVVAKQIVMSPVRDSVISVITKGAGRDSVIKIFSTGAGRDTIVSVVSNNILTNGRIDTVLSKVITTTEPLRDSILSLITNNIKQGNITGNNLSNDNGIIVTGGVGTTLKNTSLRLDSSVVAKQIVMSPVRDSVISVITKGAGRDSVIKIFSSGPGKDTIVSVVSNNILTNGRIDTVLSKVITTTEPLRDSILSLITNNIKQGNITGNNLSNDNGIIVTGGVGTTLKNTSLRLDSSVVAKQIVMSPVRDSVISVITKGAGRDSVIKIFSSGPGKDTIVSVVSNNILTNGRIDTVLSKVVTTAAPLRDSILSLITTNIKAGSIDGNNLSNDNGIIVTGGLGTTLKKTSLRLDSSVVAKQIVMSPVRDSVISVITKGAGRDSVIKIFTSGPGKDTIVSVVSNNILTNGRIDTVLSKVVTTAAPLRDSILSLITTNIKAGSIDGNNLSNDNGIIVTGGLGTTLKKTSLRLDSSVVAKQIVMSPVRDSVISVITKGAGRDSVIKIFTTGPGKDTIVSVVSNNILTNGRIDTVLAKQVLTTGPLYDSLLVLINNNNGSNGNAWKLIGNAGTIADNNFLGTTDNVDLRFRTNNTERMAVTADGHVGVGVTAPLANLDVLGNVLIGSMKTLDETNQSVAADILNVSTPTQITTDASAVTPETGIRLFRNGQSGVKWNPTVDLQVGTYAGTIDAATSFNIKLNNGGTHTPEVDVMTMLGSGNVGIGATKPASKLEVNGAATNTAAMNTKDFSKSNLAFTNTSASTYTITNVKNGGTYSFAVKASGVSAGFNITNIAGQAVTAHLAYATGTAHANHAIYTIVVMGTDAYVYFTPFTN